MVVRLLQTLTSRKEVDHYLRLYGNASAASPAKADGTAGPNLGTNFAVIKGETRHSQATRSLRALGLLEPEAAGDWWRPRFSLNFTCMFAHFECLCLLCCLSSCACVLPVGGGFIRDELDSLVSSLAFLVDVGLIPVVIHGAGPQLNAKLEARGIVSEYHGGIRVTTPEILSVARQTFAEENMKLLEALENRGVRCRGFVGGVFTADLLDESKFGLVGEVQ